MHIGFSSLLPTFILVKASCMTWNINPKSSITPIYNTPSTEWSFFPCCSLTSSILPHPQTYTPYPPPTMVKTSVWPDMKINLGIAPVPSTCNKWPMYRFCLHENT
jgi:hypothetical protein